MSRLPLRLILALVLVLLSGACKAQQAAVTLCTEPGDGPPWMYWSTSAQGSRELRGFSVDLWTDVFARMKRGVRIIGDMPWKRCLRAVTMGEVDFAIGAYRDEQRETLLAYSAPYKVLTPQVFFSERKPLTINSTADLRRYRGCGMNGSSYAHYDLAPGALDQGSRSYAALIEKLLRGHCDYFVEELEVIQQLEANRHRYLERPDLGHAPVPGARPPALHIVTAKSGDAAALLPRIDSIVAEMTRNGELLAHWKRHANGLPY